MIPLSPRGDCAPVVYRARCTGGVPLPPDTGRYVEARGAKRYLTKGSSGATSPMRAVLRIKAASPTKLVVPHSHPSPPARQGSHTMQGNGVGRRVRQTAMDFSSKRKKWTWDGYHDARKEEEQGPADPDVFPIASALQVNAIHNSSICALRPFP